VLGLGCVYLIVKDMKRSIAFYEELLQMKVSVQRFDRFAQFDFGNSIALYNPKYDEEFIERGMDVESHYSSAYLAYQAGRQVRYGNNFVLNFYTGDLAAEHQRIRESRIGEPGGIMYVNISSPYYLFLLDDPDGNTIEITGDYDRAS